MVKTILCKTQKNLNYVRCVDENDNPFGAFNGEYDTIEFDGADGASVFYPPATNLWIDSPFCFDFKDIKMNNERRLFCSKNKFETEKMLSYYVDKYPVHKYY